MSKIIKRMTAVLLSVIIMTTIFTALPFMVSAVTVVDSGTTDDCTWMLDDDGTLTISGNGSMRSYSDIAYDLMPPWRSRTTKVIIEEGVTSIGQDAFYECKNIQNIIIPESVNSIDYRAFDRCYNLTSVTIGSGVTNIESEAFYNCTSLKSVTIPYNVTSIKIRAFGYYYDRDLESICKIDNFTIYGSTGSVAEKYAKANEFVFISIPDITDPTTAEPTTEPTTAPVPNIIAGDISNDGTVNGANAGVLSRYASGWAGYADKINNWAAADINNDGLVNGADAGILSRHVSGWTQYARFFDQQ